MNNIENFKGSVWSEIDEILSDESGLERTTIQTLKQLIDRAISEISDKNCSESNISQLKQLGAKICAATGSEAEKWHNLSKYFAAQLSSQPLLPILPNELFPKIALKTISNWNKLNCCAPEELKALAPVSKGWDYEIHKIKMEWKAEHDLLKSLSGSFLKDQGCKTAKEAVVYLIEHQLPVANLRNFSDLTEELIEQLFKNCSELCHLMIKSDAIKLLPATFCRLQTLDCSGCLSLTALPELPELTTLNCASCHSLTSLPELPELTTLNCTSCYYLTALPELPELTDLDCSLCPSLASLPELPKLTSLDCSLCPSLASLPELPKLTSLDCSSCRSLTALPELPELTTLKCDYCLSLTALPELPELKKLNCTRCYYLTALSELPKLTYLDCSQCSSLTALPELPKLTYLDQRFCYSLNSPPKNVPHFFA